MHDGPIRKYRTAIVIPRFTAECVCYYNVCSIVK